MFDTAECLQLTSHEGWGLLPIPQPIDTEIAALVRSWLALGDQDRRAALNGVSEAHQFTLLCFSERMASLAVRERNPDHITLGLIALGLDGWRFDWRENAMIVWLHYDAAERIGSNAQELFDAAANVLPEKPAEVLRAFPSRPDRSLELAEYVTTADSDGFRYKRTW